MKVKLFIIVLFAVAGYALLTKVPNYFALLTPTVGNERVILATPDPFRSDAIPPVTEVPYIIEEVVRGLEIPWSIAFTSVDRMLVTERPGRIRVVNAGRLEEQPLFTFPEVSSRGEEGLMGLTLDPNYGSNKYLYVSYAYYDNGKLFVKVERLVDQGNSVTRDKVLIDKIPAATNHAGSRLKFGPDSMLYVTTGDASDKNLAQQTNNLAGKILRMTRDGEVPSDNPTPGSFIYSLGHRNPQGLAWFPQSKTLYSTEHGPSVFDGPAGGDEVNVIEAGGNYGWPIVSHENKRAGLVSPSLVFTPAVAPAAAMFYGSKVIPQFYGNLFFAMLKGEGIMRVLVDQKSPARVLSYEKLPDLNLGRIREVAEGPDGAIYFSTSNKDGRGKVRDGDDKIFRIKVSPVKSENGVLGVITRKSSCQGIQNAPNCEDIKQANISVSVVSQEATISNAKTDQAGEFKFELESGTYDLKVSLSDQETITKSFKVVKGKYTRLDIQFPTN